MGAWILEIPELSGFSRSDVLAVKAMISSTSDKVRLAYGRRASVFMRQCVFMGSTNEREYLRDSTGGRRFWPIACDVACIDVTTLADQVDQIWAEALHQYSALRARHPRAATLPLYLPRGAQEEARQLQDTRHVDTIEDAMAGQIAAWLDSPINDGSGFDDDDLLGSVPVLRTETCALQAWVDALGNDRKAYGQGPAMAIGRAMARVPGWRKTPHIRLVPKFGKQRLYTRVEEIQHGPA